MLSTIVTWLYLSAYGRIIGYRKGADGKPEIIPEQAEIIRLIFNRYLQGDSLQSIKAKLETAGALTARGNTAWSAQSIQRILQNEKYCGDVLLQKTFTEDVLTGVHKKNTGQLPQYYIENYHEGIVSKQMFREVQAEIARRNSKSAANQRKRRRGRYNSKYALSERLFCGDCGSPYKRVTWNIHGRKQNRLAVRESHRVWHEILRQLTVHPGRRTAPCHFESGARFGSKLYR